MNLLQWYKRLKDKKRLNKLHKQAEKYGEEAWNNLKREVKETLENYLYLTHCRETKNEEYIGIPPSYNSMEKIIERYNPSII